jgi:YD repeat-containing protein
VALKRPDGSLYDGFQYFYRYRNSPFGQVPQVTQETSQVQGERDFDYDDLDRLTSEVLTPILGSSHSWSYTYDLNHVKIRA